MWVSSPCYIFIKTIDCSFAHGGSYSDCRHGTRAREPTKIDSHDGAEWDADLKCFSFPGRPPDTLLVSCLMISGSTVWLILLQVSVIIGECHNIFKRHLSPFRSSLMIVVYNWRCDAPKNRSTIEALAHRLYPMSGTSLLNLLDDLESSLSKYQSFQVASFRQAVISDADLPSMRQVDIITNWHGTTQFSHSFKCAD